MGNDTALNQSAFVLAVSITLSGQQDVRKLST